MPAELSNRRNRNYLANIQPTIRKNILDLDSRFFPSGIHPGSLIEIFGASGTGKTFLVTYCLARFLTQYPDKTALIIDTRGHFNSSNLVSILNYIDPETKEQDRKLHSYLKRYDVIKSFDCDDLLAQFMTSTFESKIPSLNHEQQLTSPKAKSSRTTPSTSNLNAEMPNLLNVANESDACDILPPPSTITSDDQSNVKKIPSPLEEKLILNPNLSLIIIDSLDTFSHSPAFYSSEKCRNPDEFPNIMKLVKDAVQSTKTPVICTLSDYIQPKSLTPSAAAPTANNKPGNTRQSAMATHPNLPETEVVMMEMEDEEDSEFSNSSSDSKNPPAQNIILNQSLFTQSVVLTLLPNKNPPVNIATLFARRGARTGEGTIGQETQDQYSEVQVPGPSTAAETTIQISPNVPSETSSVTLDKSVQVQNNFSKGTGFECVAHYRSLLGSKLSSSRHSLDDHRVKFTIISGMLYVIV